MPSAYEKLQAAVNELDKKEIWKENPPRDDGKFNPETVREINSEVISADSVKAWTPHIAPEPKTEYQKLLNKVRGYEAPSRVLKADQKVLQNSKSPTFDQLMKEYGGAPVGPTASVDEDYEGTSAMEKIMEALQSETAKNIFTTLGFDEHLMVKGLENTLNKTFNAGYKEKEHLGDYTWGNFLKESGLPDNGYTTSLGLGMSIFLSPTTYLTLGTSRVRLLGNISKELGGLSVTKYGAKILNEASKDVAREAIERQLAKQSKVAIAKGVEPLTELPRQAVNSIHRNSIEKVHKAFVKTFGPNSALVDAIRTSDDAMVAVKKVGEKFELDDIVEFSGLKLEIPNTVFGLAKIPKVGGKQIKLLGDSPLRGGDVHLFGQKVLTGEEVAKIAHKAHIPQFADYMSETTPAKWGKGTADWMRKLFDTNYKAPQGLIDTFSSLGIDNQALIKESVKKYGESTTDAARTISLVEAAEREGFKMRASALKFSEDFFKPLSKDEKKEFSEVMIKASTNPKKIDHIKSITGNAKVQDRIDAFVGQGKYKNQGLSKTLAEQSKLFELDKEELPNWYMGIMNWLGLDDIKFNTPIGDMERKFLRERKLDEFGDALYAKDYTRNPVQALSVRMAQIGYHDIHEKVYQRIKDLKLGHVLGDEKLTVGQLKAKGYQRLARTQYQMIKHLDQAPDGVIQKAGEGHYVQPEFAEHYKELSRKAPLPTFLQPLNFVTNLWKGSVTRAFPAFHARNFQSNIVMNAMRIGGHAIDPRVNLRAARAMLEEPNPFTVALKTQKMGAFKRTMISHAEKAFDFISGLNKNKAWVSEIGEELSPAIIRKEALEIGLLKEGQWVEDIGGMTTIDVFNKNLHPRLHWIDRIFNPLSGDFLPNVAGQRFGRAVEDQARLANYITWRSRGLDPKTALREVNEALFDYGAITNFERSARVFIPFYTFGRKNIANHIKVMAHRPGAITAQLKFFRDIGPDSDTLREQFPVWAGRKFSTMVGEKLVMGYGVPMEDLLEIAEDPLQQAFLRMAPYMRYGLEKAANRDFFSGRELMAVNNANEFKLSLELAENENLPDFVRGTFKALNNFLKLEKDHKGKVIGDPNKLHILRSSFTSRWQSIFGQLSKEDEEGYKTAIRFLTGHMILDPDAKQQRAIEKSYTYKEIREQALKNNLARPSGMFFVGGRKVDRDLANMFITQALEGGSVRRQRRIRKRAKELFERRQEQRVGR